MLHGVRLPPRPALNSGKRCISIWKEVDTQITVWRWLFCKPTTRTLRDQFRILLFVQCFREFEIHAFHSPDS